MFKKPVSVFADIQCQKINGIEISYIKTLVEQGTSKITNITIGVLEELKNSIADYLLGNNIFTTSYVEENVQRLL